MTGVVVTGPPRSGTSAVTRLLDLAGLDVCVAADRVGGGPNNPMGHWESKSVLAVNNRLLDLAATRWWCPPPPGAPIVAGPADHDAAGAAFRAAHPTTTWVVKDPRFAFTLPFWRAALDDVTAAIIAIRRPDEVVASLRRTWPLSVEHAAALWMRYVHAALASTHGLPRAFVRFPEILADVDAALAPLAATLEPLGVELHRPDPADVDAYVGVPAGSDDDDVLTPAWRLWDAIDAAPAGVAVDIDVAPEDPCVEAVLAPLRDDLRAGRPISTRPVFAAVGDAVG